MTLTTEQLILIKDAVGTVGCVISADDVRFANTTLAFIDAELLRRKVGPFTLAEAVASGRPFRRKGAGYWTRKAPAPGDGEPFFEAMTAFDKWEPCPSVSDQHGFTVAEEWLSIDDITACDYELNLDGGD